MPDNSNTLPPTEVDTLAVEQAYQDQLITQRLPDWMASLSGPEYTVLGNALREQLACSQKLAAVFAQVRSIDDFARPLLQQALAHHTDIKAEQLYFRRWYTHITHTPTYLAGRIPMEDSDSYEVPLLEAALYNFTAQECSEQPRHNAVVDGQGTIQPGLPALDFARLCRDLDLGQRYQAHLDSCLLQQPGPQGPQMLLAGFQRHGMLADALKANAQGVLSDAELKMVIDLCRTNRPGWLEGAPVSARQLKIFGCPLQQIVVLEVIDTGVLYNTVKRVLVYVPGDPHGAWSARDDMDAYVRQVLGKRLRDLHYRRFFSRFVRRRDAYRVFAAVSERLDDVADWATRDLDEQTTAYPLPLFEHLADAWIAQIKDDAAMIAPPVAQVDRQAQAAHDKRLWADGVTLLAVAGLYVPAIGALLALVMAYELLEESFQAVCDWHDDERDAALEHLLHVGKGVAIVGATAVAAGAVRRAWAQADGWVSARLEDGSEKLWNGDLQPYRSERPPADARMDGQGVCWAGDSRWVEMQGHWYRVDQRSDDQQWALSPYRGHAPQLRHNGAGAWRLWHEQPARWRDRAMMFRRLGRPFSELDDQQIDDAMTIHGMSDEHLRALHVYGRPAEAGFIDTVSRLLLASRIQRLVGELSRGQAITDLSLLETARGLDAALGKEGQALADAVWEQRRSLLQQAYENQFPDTEASTLLRRDFPSLHRLAADEVVRMASADDQETLLRTFKVPVLMAQAARLQVMGIRVARVHEALTFDTPQNLDLARVVLRLLARQPGASERPGWRLFDGDATEALLTADGNGRPLDLVYRAGFFTLRAADGHIREEPDELFEVLARGHTAAQRATLGLAEPFAATLRQLLVREAVGQRELTVRLLGMDRPNRAFLAPLRLDDGRVGYPLSGGRFWAALGGRSPRALQARLRDLYPAFSDEQIGRWLAEQDATARLEALEKQYSLLQSHLNRWVRSALPTPEVFARRVLKKELIDCWRWLIPQMRASNEAPDRYLFGHLGSRIQRLPSIPEAVSFPHVSVLALRALRLEGVPDEFLRAFPNLKSLEVTNCRLKQLPLPPTLCQQLQVLDLSGNQITLDEGQALVLASCSSLVYLNLSFNPLARSFSIFGMPDLNALYLRGTRLDVFPFGVMESTELHTLDLRGNFLDEFPHDFHESPLWQQGRVSLFGNQLEAPSDQVSIWHWLGESLVPYRLRWLDVVPTARRDDLAARWTELEAEPGAGDLFSTLAALTSSGNFKSYPLARNFALRLLDMFEYMGRDNSLKRELFEHAAVTDCQDNATIRFSDLELRVLVWRARNGELAQYPERALLHLGGQLWRMHLVDQIAAEHALRAQASNESIEFALAYRIALRVELDLPIQQDDMLYAGIPNLTTYDIRCAHRAVNAAQSVEGLAQYLARQPFWQEHLKATFAARLRVPQDIHDELERLIELGNMEHDIQLLHIHNQQREHEVMVQLTREAMGRARTISLGDS